MENAIVHLLLNIDPNHTISIIGIIATAGIAIYSIRKTAEASRVTNTYSEMKSCLMETVLILDKVLTLLDGVAKKVVYYRIPEKEIIETAYDRYWREIGPLAGQFKEMQSKQKLILPARLYGCIQELIKEMNFARELAKSAVPRENHIYPDTSELQNKMGKVALRYKAFINDARHHLGANANVPFSKKGEEIFKTNEEVKNSDNGVK